MAKDPAFLFYSSDFITGVSTMSYEDRGKYITILAIMHQKGRMNEETIRFVVGSVSVMLKSKFSIDESGMWYNERLEQEIENRRSFVESRQNNGKLGGRPPNTKPLGYPNGKPIGKPNAKPTGKPKHNLTEDVNENVNEDVIIMPFGEKFKIKWGEWIEYRVEIKKPYKGVKSEQAAIKQLSQFDEAFACALIDKSMGNGWQGLIFENTGKEWNLYKQGKSINPSETKELLFTQKMKM